MTTMTEVDVPDSQPSRPRSGLSYVLLFGLFMLAGLVALAWIGRPPTNVAIGEAFPKLDLKPLLYTDTEIQREDLLGKLTVLHFWGTWCGYCQMEFPEFVELAREFESHPEVQIISISSSSGAEYDLEQLAEETEQFMQERSAVIPTYSDPAALTRGQLALLMPQGSLGYPTTVLVDRDGKIAQVLPGYRPGDMQELAATIHDML